MLTSRAKKSAVSRIPSISLSIAFAFASFVYASTWSQISAYSSFTIQNYALTDHQYKVISNVEFSKCVKACKSERGCISVNFGGSHESKGCCVLNGCGVEDEDEKGKSLVFTPGCMYHQVRSTEAAILKGGKYTNRCPAKNKTVNGNWSEWSTWSNCSKVCNNGTRMRSRTCTNPPPSVGGSNCSGSGEAIEACNIHDCPVNGNWTDWSNWSNCSRTCGGTRMRNRTCTNPPPSNGGSQCSGSNGETEMCNAKNCTGLQKDKPASSCKELTNLQRKTGTYWLDLDGGSYDNAFQAFCDMDIDGGGWTLVWSYTFTDYSHFASASNAITPRPNWIISESVQVPVSTQVPLTEKDLGALKFDQWKQIGREFLMKSNINNWVACVPNIGNLIEWKSGDVTCRMVKQVATLCKNTLPYRLNTQSRNGPSLSGDKLYHYYEGSTDSNWPVHDPCGANKPNQLKGVVDPRGSIYIR